METYKNVPPEKQSTQPVDQVRPSSPPSRPRPNVCTIAHVASAPMGAARLKNARCVRAVFLDNPCFSRTDVRPNAAGALCSMMAKNITNDSEVEGAVEEAPSAMPSAHA
jgi:hypothetical protein